MATKQCETLCSAKTFCLVFLTALMVTFTAIGLYVIDDFWVKVEIAQDNWRNKAVEDNCVVERLRQNSTVCDLHCEHKVPSLRNAYDDLSVSLLQEALEGNPLAGAPFNGPEKCQKAGLNVECPCRLEETTDMSAVQVKFEAAPWASGADSCTLINWAETDVPADAESKAFQWTDTPNWTHGLNEASVQLPCVYLAGDGRIRDILLVGFKRGQMIDHLDEMIENLGYARIAFIIWLSIWVCIFSCCFKIIVCPYWDVCTCRCAEAQREIRRQEWQEYRTHRAQTMREKEMMEKYGMAGK